MGVLNHGAWSRRILGWAGSRVFKEASSLRRRKRLGLGWKSYPRFTQRGIGKGLETSALKRNLGGV